ALLAMQTATALLYLGQTNEAKSRLEQVVKEKPADALLHSTLAILFAVDGDAASAEQAISRASESQQGALAHFHHAPYNLACACSLLRSEARAIDWLKKAAAEGYPCYPRFEKDPLLQNLRNQPQFKALLSELRERFDQYKKTL